jgi:tetratricopeptide (TPR) repeat protein
MALNICEKIIGSEEDTWEVWLLKADALQKQEKFVAAIQTYQTALKLNDESPEIHANLGSAFFNLAQYGEAEKSVKKALKIDETMAEANYFMGNIEYVDFNLVAAIKHYDKAVAKNPNYRDALFMRAAAHAERQDFSKAILDYEKVLEIDPDLDAARINIASLYVMDENYEKALQEMEKVEVPDKDVEKDFYFFKAEALYFSGKEEESCEFYEKASSLGDEEASEIFEKYCINKEERKARKSKRVIEMSF